MGGPPAYPIPPEFDAIPRGHIIEVVWDDGRNNMLVKKLTRNSYLLLEDNEDGDRWRNFSDEFGFDRAGLSIILGEKRNTNTYELIDHGFNQDIT